MAGTSPPPPTTRLTKPPPSGRYSDPAALAKTLIDEQLKESRTSRLRTMWEFLKRLFRRSSSSGSSSSERGNGGSGSGSGDEQAEPLLRQEREPETAQENRKPSEARRALESLTLDQVRDVAVATWKLIDENPKYRKAYEEGRLPLAEELRELLPRNPEMAMSPLAKPLTLAPSAEERFSRTAPVSDDTAKSRPGTSDGDSKAETRSQGDVVTDTMSLVDAVTPVPLLDPSSKAFLDSFMARANPSPGGPGDHGDALTAQSMFDRRRSEMKAERERPADSANLSGPERAVPSNQNPVGNHVGNLLPERSPGAEAGRQSDESYYTSYRPPARPQTPSAGAKKSR
ncbi:hypothetical protein ACFVGN_10570 [Streptomyces sp. NPDC057757]|uniref:hypothetical protein n=1 Tax=Streptomyces sp. NPDC057757 TaxID=3346241 RepID=UPI00369032F1